MMFKIVCTIVDTEYKNECICVERFFKENEKKLY